jgi:uroporphyrinogen decarboxylase
MGTLLFELADRARALLGAKRTGEPRLSVPLAVPSSTPDARLHDSPFLRACRREPVPYTPVWLMRQAGRYMPEYRALRGKVSFLDLCKTPDLACAVTVDAAVRLGVDAAIIFSDLLVVLEPMGAEVTYTAGDGPSIGNPVREGEDVARVRELEPDALAYVYAAIRMARAALPADLPLLGFAGAPFTLASYLIEGGASRNYEHVKLLMYRDARAWHVLLDRLARGVAAYLVRQAAAGAQAVQLFDSWVGCLSPRDYAEFVLPHTRRLIDTVRAAVPGLPIIHFGTGCAGLLSLMKEAGGDVIGLDWRVELGETWARLGHDVGVQGNLDPVALFADPAEIRRRARAILEAAGGRPGHVFNLGHGVLPDSPVDALQRLVDLVHEETERSS